MLCVLLPSALRQFALTASPRLSGSLATCVGYGGFGGTKFRPDPSRELMPRRFPRMESVFAACPTEIGHLCAGIQEKRRVVFGLMGC